MLRNPRLSARYLPKLVETGRHTQRSGTSSRASNRSSNNDVYVEISRDVMQLSYPAFRCGVDVVLFDEKRKSNPRAQRGITMRGSEYYDPINSERTRLSRYNELNNGMWDMNDRYRRPQGYPGGSLYDRRGIRSYENSSVDSRTKGSEDGIKIKKPLSRRATNLDANADIYDLNAVGPYGDYPHDNGYYGNHYGGNPYGRGAEPYGRYDDTNYLPRLNDPYYQQGASFSPSLS